MGQRTRINFDKRFGGRIRMVYAQKSSVSEKQLQNGKLCMAIIKERGVKNFRVLNKQELSDVLKNIGDQKAIDAIVAGAVARWKSGWGKGKDKTKTKA